MLPERWKPENPENGQIHEIVVCPEGHENPRAWRHACDACEKRCVEENELLSAEEKSRKSDLPDASNRVN